MKKYLLIFAFFLSSVFSSCQPSFALTLSNIRTHVRRSIKDNYTDTTRHRYTDAIILDYVNEAQKEVNNALWLGYKTTSYVLSPLTTYYNLPTDLTVVNLVYFTNIQRQTIILNEKTQRPLYEKDPSWDLTSGSPIQYWISYTTLPANQTRINQRITYMPIPTRTSTGTITVWYFYQFPDLANDSDVPFDNLSLLYSYHIVLAYYAIARISEIENKAETATIYNTLYSRTIQLMKEQLGKMPGYSPGFSAGKN